MISPFVKLALLIALVIAALPLVGLTGVGVFWVLGLIAIRLYALFGAPEPDSEREIL